MILSITSTTGMFTLQFDLPRVQRSGENTYERLCTSRLPTNIVLLLQLRQFMKAKLHCCRLVTADGAPVVDADQ